MLLKWLGISAVKYDQFEDERLRSFTRFAAASDLGHRYIALTLVLLNRTNQAREVVTSKNIILNEEERADAELVFGERPVHALFRITDCYSETCECHH